MLSTELEFCLNQAFHQAREARHEFLTVEHLLLAIFDAPRVRETLKTCRSTSMRPPRGSPRATIGKYSRRSASSACCSGPCFTCSRAARRKSAS
jgi:ATP-dependent Clp protease ATP-binding subunit ClpA